MNRTLGILIVMVGVCWSTEAGDRFAIGLSAGTMTPNSTSKRLGIGVLGSVVYSPFEDIAINLSSGYMTWGYQTSREYNTRVVPVILGARYYFALDGFRPYASAELVYSIGEVDWATMSRSGQMITGTESISEVGPGLGLGFQAPLAERLNIDVGSAILLTTATAQALNIRLMLGVNFLL